MMGQQITIRGRVQGVGFRPYVWRLATACGLCGRVCNDGAGVHIEIWGDRIKLDAFRQELGRAPPPLAQITDVTATRTSGPMPQGFEIVDSRGGAVTTEITPDAATCAACLAEVFDPKDRRFGYPFTNCTHCGPRLSIIRGVPYDRAKTSMRAFEMCGECRAEYHDPNNRRFHAQPNACPTCGPQIWLESAQGRLHSTDPISEAARRLMQGDIAAIKGIGGFHLVCDATNPGAVHALRQRKNRQAKPLAIMARDLSQVRDLCHVSEAETELLTGPEAPIVLLDRRGDSDLTGIAPGLRQIGVMLPHSPLHHLLMAQVDGPLVMTSGNPSHAPQVTENDAARTTLAGTADLWVMHDRDIVNRLDDSLVRMDQSAPIVLRRGRGMAPAALTLPDRFSKADGVLAMGALQKSTFCQLQNGQAVPSPHIGDLTTAEVYADFHSKIALYRKILEFTPDIIAVDQHPNYLSTRWGQQLAIDLGVRLVEVQHHHAHLASCLAEHGVAPGDDRSVGLILDGTGLGTDGTIWGGELLLGGYGGFKRCAHFVPVALPGGELAVRTPWRSLVAHLHAAFGPDWQRQIVGTHLVDALRDHPVALTTQMIEQRLNAPLASSAGRLFDAVSAALGIAFAKKHYEEQAAMELEALVGACAGKMGYPVAVNKAGVLSWAPMWLELLSDLRSGIAHHIIATKFHIGLSTALVDQVAQVATTAKVRRVVLSGGVMQNQILLRAITEGLVSRDFDVLCHRKLPANDGGLSLGQACIAASKAI